MSAAAEGGGSVPGCVGGTVLGFGGFWCEHNNGGGRSVLGCCGMCIGLQALPTGREAGGAVLCCGVECIAK